MYVKMIHDRDIDAYYWHVDFISTIGSKISIVIDKDTGKILVDNVNIL